MMLMDMMHHSVDLFGDPALGWLMVISNFKDEAPWLYEIGMEVYYALQGRDGARVERAIDRLERVLSTARRGPFAKMIVDSPEMEMAVHELGNMAHHLFRSGVRPSAARVLPKPKVKPDLEKS